MKSCPVTGSSCHLDSSLQADPARQPIRLAIIRYVISGLILAAFVVLVEVYFGWSALLRPWLQLSLAKMLMAVALVLISYWLRAMRLYDYFRDEMHTKFSLCLKLMLQHNLVNNLLPMRMGELSFPVLMTRYFKVPMIRSFPALLAFRLLDLHTLFLFALITVAGHWLGMIATVVLLCAWVALPCVAITFSGRLGSFIATRPPGKLRSWLNQAWTGLPQTPRSFYMSWMWTLINWAVKLGVFAWILMMFIDVPLAAAWTGAITGDLTSVLPIHGLAGAGTFEAGVVTGLMPYRVSASAALQAAINLHIFVLATTLIGGALSLLLGPSRGNNRQYG